MDKDESAHTLRSMRMHRLASCTWVNVITFSCTPLYGAAYFGENGVEERDACKHAF